MQSAGLQRKARIGTERTAPHRDAGHRKGDHRQDRRVSESTETHRNGRIGRKPIAWDRKAQHRQDGIATKWTAYQRNAMKRTGRSAKDRSDTHGTARQSTA